MAPRQNERRLLLLVGLALALGVIAVYAQVHDHAFLTYDDDEAITANPGLQLGLSPAGIAWAFRTTLVANWIPLTVLSLLADQSVHGLAPGSVLLENVALHALATLLLFHVFRRMTGTLWQSAAVAAVFALHPLHVESVAWAAMRKDTLSGVFFMLALLAHLRFVEKPGAARQAVVALACVCGLLAKPTLVTLPFVLLLLDYWPLRRLVRKDGSLDGRRLRSALVEKLPLFVLVAASSVATLWAQGAAGAIVAGKALPPGTRLANALVTYVDYVRTSLWPSGLAAFYPAPTSGVPLWEAALCGLLLLAATLLAIRSRLQRPWIFVGWLWFVGMLVPTIGLVQVGSQARADRYMYLPLIGLSILPIWASSEWAATRPALQRALPVVAAVVFAALGASAYQQVGYWRDGVALFQRVQAVTTENALSHAYLGKAFLDRGRGPEAADEMRKAMALDPGYVEMLNNLAWLLATDSSVTPLDPAEPTRLAVRAVQLTHSSNPSALYTLAVAQAREGSFGQAARTAARAAALARALGNVPLAQEIEARAAQYQAGHR
jgi:hypothetical protein